MKKTPIPRLPKFYPRKQPLKASELNRLVDAINAMATRIEEPEVKRKKQQEFLFPFYPRYRYDAATGNGYVSVTSGKLIEWPIFTSNGYFYHEVENTWQPPDEPIEMQIYTGNQISLQFSVDAGGNVVESSASIEITAEDITSNSTDQFVKLAVLREREDVPNGASSEEWSGLDYYAAGSHVYFTGLFLSQGFTANVCNGGTPDQQMFIVQPPY